MVIFKIAGFSLDDIIASKNTLISSSVGGSISLDLLGVVATAFFENCIV